MRAPRARRTLHEVFLDTLGKMAGASATGRVSSNALEAKLNWQVDKRYSNTKRELIRQGKVRAYPGGAGGTLECVGKVAKEAQPAPLKAFVSYSHFDADLKNELLKHLDPLRRAGLVDHWHDGDISAGQEWERAIETRLRAADLIIFLITVDFINSEYCYDNELAAAVDRHKANKARLIPVIGRECLWQNLSFGHIQAVLGGKAVMSRPNRDEALTDVAKEIKAIAEKLRAGRATAA